MEILLPFLGRLEAGRGRPPCLTRGRGCTGCADTGNTLFELSLRALIMSSPPAFPGLVDYGDQRSGASDGMIELGEELKRVRGEIQKVQWYS